MDDDKKKRHQKRHSGVKASRKKVRNRRQGPSDDSDKHLAKSKHSSDPESSRKRNPKAFTFNSFKKTAKLLQRGADVSEKKIHIPLVDRTPLEPPPIIVAIVGPTKVGKTTLLKGLLRHYMRQKLGSLAGPITVVTGKKRRVTFVEVPNDINAMIDCAKVADFILLLIDASYGFEMETFEFLHIAKAHGEPRIMGVLTHMDLIDSKERLKSQRKRLKHRFWAETYKGSKLFYLTRIKDEQYMHNEVKNLARFISVMKFRPLLWRTTHPYVLVDRYEDITDIDLVKQSPTCPRSVCVYGYVRGTNLKDEQAVHMPGVGDMRIASITSLSDPCPLPDELKKRSLNDRERMVYAPLCGLGGIVYDKDAIYIDTSTSHHHKETKVNPLLNSLANSQRNVNDAMQQAHLSLFNSSSDKTVEKDETLSSNDNAMSEDMSGHDDTDDSGLNSEVSDAEDSAFVPQNDDKPLRLRNVSIKNDSQVTQQAESENDFMKSLGARISSMYDKRSMGQTKINWMKLVYDERDSNNMPIDEDGDNYQNDDMFGGMFKISIAQKRREANLHDKSDAFDSCAYLCKKTASTQTVDIWNTQDMRDSIKDCFVTGRWEAKDDAFAQNTLSDDNDDDVLKDGNTDASDDNDDIISLDDDEDAKMDTDGETGDDVNESADENEDLRVVGKTDEELKLERQEKKQNKKKRRLKNIFAEENDFTNEHYTTVKNDLMEQADKNRLAFAELDNSTRAQLEGHRAGMYVRIRFDNCPCELLNNFDPKYMYIVGGLLPLEQNVGAVQVRIKKHRWYPRLLKTRDPLILSLGWRRFQTIMLYLVQEHNGRNRLLKYTPEHLYCQAAMWGPYSPQNTPFMALQSVSDDTTKHFRIAATGVLTNVDKSLNIVKKLKMTGYPYEIFKKTAFIKGMFNSALEVARFEGAQLRAVSGLRGQIKKALKDPPGAFRATFEDKILMKDIVFMRAWVSVPLPHYYTPVCNLLLDDKIWQGMKTVGQLRFERNLQMPNNKNSLYRTIERREYIPENFTVPRSLQKALPYEYKPKNEPRPPKDERELLVSRHTAVVMEPHESKVHTLMNILRANAAENRRKQRAEMVKRVRKHRAQLAVEESKKTKRIRLNTKNVCRRLSKQEKSVLKRAIHDLNKSKR